jgi:hypothetical protein
MSDPIQDAIDLLVAAGHIKVTPPPEPPTLAERIDQSAYDHLLAGEIEPPTSKSLGEWLVAACRLVSLDDVETLSAETTDDLRAALSDYDWMTADRQRAMLPLDLVRWAADRIDALTVAHRTVSEWNDEQTAEIERLRARLDECSTNLRLLAEDDIAKADEVERLRQYLKDMAFMSANKAPQPDDTHVETFMPVAAWKEYRP